MMFAVAVAAMTEGVTSPSYPFFAFASQPTASAARTAATMPSASRPWRRSRSA
jgi:hypothetical protein